MSEGDDDDGEDVIEDGEEEENEKRDSGYGSQGQIKKPVSGRVQIIANTDQILHMEMVE